MEPGERRSFACESPSCYAEFDIIYEPSHADGGIGSSDPVEHCPFCGGNVSER